MHNRFDDQQLDRFYSIVQREISRLPDEERRQTQLELRLHLEEIIAARIEAGQSETDALADALNQFGDPRRLGRKLRGEWKKGRRLNEDTFVFALCYCQACMGGVVAANFVLFLLVNMACGLSRHWEFVDPVTNVMPILTAFSMCVIAGPIAGRKLGMRALGGLSANAAIGLALFTGLCFIAGTPKWDSVALVALMLAMTVAIGYAFGKDKPKTSTG